MWRINTTNRGGTGWSEDEVFGLPNPKAKWKKSSFGDHPSDAVQVCLTEDVLYLVSYRKQVIAASLSKGHVLWSTELPGMTGMNLAIDENCVWAAPYLLDRRTGQLLRDVAADFGVKPVDRWRSQLTSGGYLMEVGEPSPGVHYLTKEGESFFSQPKFEYELMYSWDDPDYVYGLLDDRLTCRHLRTGRIQWRAALPESEISGSIRPMLRWAVLKHRIYVLVNFEALWCLDASTGEVVWKNAPDRVAESFPTGNGKPMHGLLACLDRVYLRHDATTLRTDISLLQCHDITDGRRLWTIEATQAKFGPIAGDLIFGSIHGCLPSAWDRYTGEWVWSADKPMPNHSHTIASGRHVIFSTHSGALYCHAWDTPLSVSRPPERRS